MKTSFRSANSIIRELSQHAAKARDANDFRTLANDVLKKTIGWDFAVWSVVDPPTMLFTNCILFDGRPENMRFESKFFELEFAGGDVNQFVDLASAKRPAGSLHVVTEGNPARSRRFREFMQQIGYGDELRAVFKTGAVPWGTLAAYRAPDTMAFSVEDSTLVSQVGQVVAEGIRHSLLRTAAEAPHRLEGGPGLVILSEDWRMLEITSTAERWLSLIGGSTGWSPAVHSVAEKTKVNGAVVTIPVRTQTGQWLLLHGSRTSNGAIAVIIEEGRGIHLTEVISSHYGLTPRERTVTECVLQGQSTKDIAKQLKISAYTVQDHLKSIFEKAGIRSRGELASMIFNGHYMERRRARSTPSPYGWYLDDEVGK